VDDGSTDNSREIIASYGDQIVPVLKKNGGQASALNAGFTASRGEIICFLDSDDVLLREKVAKVVSVFESHRDIGCCLHPYSLVNDDAGTLLNGTLLKAGDEVPSRKWDLRHHIESGKLPKSRDKLGFTVPGLLGSCFTRSLLEQILPMPEAASVSLSDNYIKFVAFALSKGFFLGEVLALQRIHGDNAYTLNDDRLPRARISVLTAYWMRKRLPGSARFTNKLLAAGVSAYRRAGGVEVTYKGFVDEYLGSASSLEKVEIALRILYYRLRRR
jgi:glycosyltransferase involved in cell wall biosynthesis